MRKKTHEEYVEELKIKNPDVEVIGIYAGLHTSIEHHCLKHDVYWNTAPSRVLKGCGCEECRKEKFRKKRCIAHEDYISMVNEVNKDIKVIGHYIDMKTKILHKCKIHRIEWLSIPDNILKGGGCQKCRNEKLSLKNKKTQKEYIDDLKNVNPNIKLIGEYKTANDLTLHQCLICNHTWNAKPGNILSGKGCPFCNGGKRKSHKGYVEELKVVNHNIIVLDEYINAKTKILHKCLVCGYEWMVVPSSILHGCGCPECGKKSIGNSNRKKHEEYVQDLYNVNQNVIPLEKYKGADIKTLHKCLVCNNKWSTTPSKLLSGYGCPRCNRSYGEKAIETFLELNNVTYIAQKTFSDCKNKKPLPFDFYLPEYNTCIEYQGKQHYKAINYFGGYEKFKLQQQRDKIKRDYCKNNNIKLLEIPYWNFDNIEQTLTNYLKL